MEGGMVCNYLDYMDLEEPENIWERERQGKGGMGAH
ncbi:hypothetical protein SLEP1_g43012 [Rubroshorea leprosula]|uniref:Uncharacterized protein n=1 Tax=Rubroshorea leprosula TaxID=152421 RepID=A0AAV5LBM5_9ROSI|nr:hypothetical protein SLEP1_g43012 [Rubroshorea leprosula]